MPAIFLLSFLVCLSATAHGASTDSLLSVLDQPIVPTLLKNPALVLDLDGDNKPDFAISRREGNNYTFVIRLSSRPEELSFNFLSNETDIALFAFDIDGDNDQDLLIASPTSLKPLAVWINDGHGHFERNDHGLKTTFSWARHPLHYGHSDPEDNHALITSNDRSPLERSDLNPEILRIAVSRLIPFREQKAASQLREFKLQTRPPPLLRPLNPTTLN